MFEEGVTDLYFGILKHVLKKYYDEGEAWDAEKKWW